MSSAASGSSAYSAYDTAFASDAATLLANVNTYLPLSFYYNDEDRISFYLRRLMHVWELKQEKVCTRFVKQEWIRLLMTQLLEKGEKLQIHIQIKIMSIIIALYRHEKNYDLSFDWKALYSYLSRYHLNDSTRSISIFASDSMAQHQRTLVKLIAKSRRYFVGGGTEVETGGFASPIPISEGSVGEEVLNTFIPFLSPFDNKYFASQALICLFFPSHLRTDAGGRTLPGGSTPGATYGSYHKLMKLYTPFTSNLIDICPLTIQLNMQIYARMSKHAIGLETGDGVELLAPFVERNLTRFFSTYLQTLELDIGGKASSNSHRHWTSYTELIHGNHRPHGLNEISEHFSKLIVYHLHRGQGDANVSAKKETPQGMLTSLLYTLRTYVHPSQTSGRSWHDAIGTLLERLARHYCKRLGREIRGEVSYDKKYFLDPNNYDFVLSLHPIALQGLYSKSPNMIAHCETCLRHLGTFFPKLILPGLMESVELSLVDVNNSHRMMSNLQLMTTIANVVFNTEISIGTGGGSAWLINLMNLSLPGISIIDPAKTSFTMTWLAILFYILPIVDAREGGSSGGEDAQLPSPASLAPPARYALEASAPTPDAYAEAVEQARTTTMQFEDWSLAYVDTIVSLLRSSDKFAKSDYIDRAFARLLYKNTRAFFSALSPSIFKLVSTKVIKMILSEHDLTSLKHWGCIVHTMSLAQSEMILQAFIPAALKKLVVKDALAPLADSELQWLTHLIGQAVKQAGGATPCADATKAGLKGELLLPYVAGIQQVYKLTSGHDSKSVRKSSRKMIRNLLKGLTFTYPAEWKNFSPIDDWNRLKPTDGSQPWEHWKAWGTYRPKSEPFDGMPIVDIIWHVPTPKEMAAAEALIVDVIEQPLTWIARWIDGEERDAVSDTAATTSTAVGKSDTPLERSLQSIISALRGIQPVMGSIEGPEYGSTAPIDEDDHDQAYTRNGLDHGSRCPAIAIHRTQPLKPLGGAVAKLIQIGSAAMHGQPAVQSLRTHLVRFTHQAFVRARALAKGPIHSQPSTKSTTLLLKLAAQVLAGYGAKERQLHVDRQNGRYSRARLRDLLTGVKSRLRPQLNQKVYDFHLIRMNELSYTETYTADIHDLIVDLQFAATNDFTKVRSKATYILVVNGLRRFPQAIDMTIDAMIKVFSNIDGTTSDESLLGCMGVLANTSMVGWVSRKWYRMSKLLHAFFQYGEKTSHDDKVQIFIQQLFNAIFSNLQVKTVQIPFVDEKKIPTNLLNIIDTNKVARRNQSIQAFNKTLSRTYLQLMTFLHNHSSGQLSSPDGTDDGKVAHWRYSLMSSAFFFNLSRVQHYDVALRTVDSTDGLITYNHYVNFFLKGITSTLAPLRQISFLAVSKILGTHTLHVREELNRIAELAIGTNPASILASIDTGVTTPIDPSASLSKTGSILTFTSIESEEELKGTIFYDYLYSGWMADIYNTVMCKYTPNTSGKNLHFNAYTYFTPLSVNMPLRFPYKPLSHTPHTPVAPLSDVSLAAIFDFFTSNSSKNLQTLIDHFVHAHPTLVPTHDGHANERVGDGAGDQIATLVTRNIIRNKLFPTTRFNAKSGAFSMVHVNLIRGLIESFPQLIMKEEYGLVKMIQTLIQSTEEPDKACTAAEILCGISVAIKHFTHATQVACQKVLLPLWMQSVQTVQPDCLDHYGDALRHLYTNMDPRRLAWLSKSLFTDALQELPSTDFIAENLANARLNPRILDLKGEAAAGNAPSSPSSSAATAARNVATNTNESPSVQFKRLRFILPILIEVGYRGCKLGEWIVTTFKKKGFLYHPYKQVREEISWILFIITRNEFALYENHPAQSPGGRITEPASTLSVVSSPVYLQFLYYIREQFDSVRTFYRQDKNNPAGSPKELVSPDSGIDLEKHLAEQRTRARNFTETVLTWLHAVLVCGDAVFVSTFYQAFLPYVLWAQSFNDPEIAAIAKFAGAGAAWINAGGQALEPVSTSGVIEPAEGVCNLHDAESLPFVQALSLTEAHSRRAPLDSTEQVIDNILSNLRATTLSCENTWHVRVAIARFLQIWIPRHSLALNSKQQQEVEDLLIDTLLQDAQIEVREAASHAFTSFISSSFPLVLPTKSSLLDVDRQREEDGGELDATAASLAPHAHIETITKKLTKLVVATGVSKKLNGKVIDGASLAQRHGALLGLSSLVLTHPYDVPLHLPTLLSFLGTYVEDRNQSISSTMRKFFASFTASHKDEWETQFSKLFTIEQLEDLQSMQIAPAYFA